MRWSRLLRRRRAAAPPPEPLSPAPVALSAEDREKMRLLLTLVNDRSQPNLNDLGIVVRNLDALALNVKAMGYDLARQLAAALPPPFGTAARPVGLSCKISTQADIESDWMRHWMGELQVPIFYHRKLWEYGYLLQALFDSGHLAPGSRGLGFGCGTEATPSYLAARGVFSTITDLEPDEPRARIWAASGQHAESLDAARQHHLIDADTFARHVTRRYVDMNDIPEDLAGYDFCWSLCALEHLGSIDLGLAFIENSLKTLRPGGTAVHSMEFNVDPNGPTIDNWPTVFFQRKHIEALAERLGAAGHRVAPLDFDLGDQPLDHFIDLPPWGDYAKGHLSDWLGQPCHLKVAADGFVVSCFGVIVTKSG